LALAVKGSPVYGDHGFDGESVAWKLPGHITPAMIAEAKRVLPDAEAILAPTTREGMLRWIANLGLRCRSTPDPEQAKAQAVSYCEGFERAKIPGLAFTVNTLERAAATFKFFPAYAELRDFLMEQAGPQIRLARRLREVAEASPTPKDEGNGKAWKDMTESERTAFEAKLAAARAKMVIDPRPIGTISAAVLNKIGI